MDYLKEYNVFDGLDLPDSTELEPIDEMQLALAFIKNIVNDEQLDRMSNNYEGFINVFEDGFGDPKIRRGFLMFLKYKTEFDNILRTLGLTVEAGWDEDETIITKIQR